MAITLPDPKVTFASQKNDKNEKFEKIDFFNFFDFYTELSKKNVDFQNKNSRMR